MSVRKNDLCDDRKVNLAQDDIEHDFPRALVPYSPLYPTFQERLNNVRRGEQVELLRRADDHVVHNFVLYGSRRSSEDTSVDLVTLGPDDLITPVPPDSEVLEERPTDNGEDHDNGSTDKKFVLKSTEEQGENGFVLCFACLHVVSGQLSTFAQLPRRRVKVTFVYI